MCFKEMVRSKKKCWVRSGLYRKDTWKNGARKSLADFFMYINGGDHSLVCCKSTQSLTYYCRHDNSICTPKHCSLSSFSMCSLV